MAETFYDRPILNSPYEPPGRHHDLDEDGQPTDRPPVAGRRRSKLITPVPKPRKRRKAGRGTQESLVFQDAEGLTDAGQEYNPTPIINEIRDYVAAWRNLPNPNDWQVTPVMPPPAPPAASFEALLHKALDAAARRLEAME